MNSIRINALSKEASETASDQIIQLSLNKKEQERVMAILECFGARALMSNREVTISSGELISSWGLEGACEVEDLLKVYTIEIIIDIYDSGL